MRHRVFFFPQVNIMYRTSSSHQPMESTSQKWSFISARCWWASQRVMSLTRDGPLNTERARKRIIDQLSISTYVWLVLNRNRVAEDTNRSNTVPDKSQFCVILVRILVKYSNFWAIFRGWRRGFLLTCTGCSSTLDWLFSLPIQRLWKPSSIYDPAG